jgi:hypothetical protein
MCHKNLTGLHTPATDLPSTDLGGPSTDAHITPEGIMRTLSLKTLLAGAAAALLIAGCTDTTSPPHLQAPDGEGLASTGETEIHRYLVAGPYVDWNLTHRWLPDYAAERNLPQVLVYRYGDTESTLYTGWAFYVDVEVHFPTAGIDPDYRGTLWSMVEKGAARNQYNVYYRFDLYDLTGDKTLIGTFLARQQASCPKLPCAPKSSVEILKTTGTGVLATGFSALMNTQQSTLKNDPDYGAMLYVWLNGTLTWNMSDGGEEPPPPDDPEPKCTPAMARKGLC